MTKQILKPIAVGILIGGVLYAMPFFFFRGFFFFLLIWFVFRFLFWGRWGWSQRSWRWQRHTGIHPAFADTIRNMSDEEYEVFKKKFDHDRMSEDANKREDVKNK